jgi:catechol 2,3-dioxygenase-like lactoylglutathione lyase family enzyme
MPALHVDHFTVLTDQLAATQAFYERFGFVVGARPEMLAAGRWLYLGPQAALHLVEVPELPVQRKGVLDHMAFRAQGLAATCATLKALGLRYSLQRFPAPTGDWQLFFKDPNGATVEFDFEGHETDLPAAQSAPEAQINR